ncbi:MAG: thermosome subunit beta, partial [Candidatus Thermoplasmatota archaeon]|nr:thermosome subunit beta [Candidatus Thermoplasmatota archaeon]
VVTQEGGSVDDTLFVEGVIIDKERVHTGMPKRVENAKVALLNSALEVKKTEVDAKIQITDPTQLQAFLDEEENLLRKMVDQIVDTGANVLFCQKGIDDLVQHFLAKKGIYAVRRVKKSDMEKLERATGARIVSNLEDLDESDLGAVNSVEERTVGDDKFTFVEGNEAAKSVSLLIRGGTEHVVDEIERSLEDAIRVVGVAIEDGKIVPGGGAPEIELALRLREYASTVGGREQLAIEAFADALEVIPRTLAENAGLDAINAIVDLRAAHESDKKTFGFDVFTGEVTDMKANNVIEPLRVKTQALQSATEVATMILRIDDVIAAKAFGGGEGGDMPDMDF